MIQTNFTPFPVLETERLILRPLEASDAEDIFMHRSDNIINTYLEDFRHATIDDTQAFITRVQGEIAMGKTILWVLSRKGNPQFRRCWCFHQQPICIRRCSVFCFARDSSPTTHLKSPL